MSILFNMKDLPVPFIYIYWLCLVQAIYLPLLAVTVAIAAGTGANQTHWTSGVLQGLILLCQSAFVVGMRMLGQAMSDPYGDDLIDLSVMFYVHHTWLHSQRILKSHFPEPADALVEQRLIYRRDEKLGAAWETDTGLTSKDFATTYTPTEKSIELLLNSGDNSSSRSVGREKEDHDENTPTTNTMINQMANRIVKNP